MRIKRFDVQWMGGRATSSLKADLNEDLTIFTGRNGSGKTTLLKLLWYVISGNVEHATREVPFSQLQLVTDLYTISIRRRSGRIDEIIFSKDGEETRYEGEFDEEGDYRAHYTTFGVPRPKRPRTLRCRRLELCDAGWNAEAFAANAQLAN